MTHDELDHLLSDALGTDLPAPAYLNVRLQGRLALHQRERRTLSIWWLPLALSFVLAVGMVLISLVLPFPISLILSLSARLSVLITGIFTAVGVRCYGLREKGRLSL